MNDYPGPSTSSLRSDFSDDEIPQERFSSNWREKGDGNNPFGELGRVPPSNLDAEAAVLSAMLLSRDVFDSVQEILEPEHFYSDANRRVFDAIVDLNDKSRPVDTISVAGWLRDKGRLDQIGGTPYLAQLVDATPAIAHVEEHARVIR